MDSLRRDALTAALVTYGDKANPDIVLAAAARYAVFLAGNDVPVDIVVSLAEAPAPLPAPAPTPPPAAPKPKTKSTPPKAPPAKAPPANEPPEEAAHKAVIAKLKAEEAIEDAEIEAPAATAEQVGKAITDLLAANQRETAVALLKKYGATSKSSLKEQDYAAFLKDADEALAA